MTNTSYLRLHWRRKRESRISCIRGLACIDQPLEVIVVLQCWEHRNAAFRCITGGWTNKKSKLNSSSLQNQNFNHRVVFVVDCYLLLEICNVLFYLAMSGLYLLWAVICDSKSGMLAEVILVIKPWHSRAV